MELLVVELLAPLVGAELDLLADWRVDLRGHVRLRRRGLLGFGHVSSDAARENREHR